MGTLPAMFVSLHEAATRGTSLGLGYNAALAPCGGTAPLVAMLLIDLSASSAATAIHLVATALVCRMLVRFVPAQGVTR